MAQIHISSFFNPNEWCAVYAATMVHRLDGRIPDDDLPGSCYEELLWGSKYLWDNGVPFMAIDFNDDGSIQFLQAEPVKGSFPAPIYMEKKGLEWILTRAIKHLEKVGSWLKEDIDMIRGLQHSVRKKKKKVARLQRQHDLN